MLRVGSDARIRGRIDSDNDGRERGNGLKLLIPERGDSTSRTRFEYPVQISCYSAQYMKNTQIMLNMKKKEYEKKIKERIESSHASMHHTHDGGMEEHAMIASFNNNGTRFISRISLMYTDRDIDNIYNDMGSGFLDRSLYSEGIITSTDDTKYRNIGFKSNKYDNNLKFIDATKVYGVKKIIQNTRKVNYLLT